MNSPWYKIYLFDCVLSRTQQYFISSAAIIMVGWNRTCLRETHAHAWPERKPAWDGFELAASALARNSIVIALRLSHGGPAQCMQIHHSSIPPIPIDGSIPIHSSAPPVLVQYTPWVQMLDLFISCGSANINDLSHACIICGLNL